MPETAAERNGDSDYDNDDEEVSIDHNLLIAKANSAINEDSAQASSNNQATFTTDSSCSSSSDLTSFIPSRFHCSKNPTSRFSTFYEAKLTREDYKEFTKEASAPSPSKSNFSQDNELERISSYDPQASKSAEIFFNLNQEELNRIHPHGVDEFLLRRSSRVHLPSAHGDEFGVVDYDKLAWIQRDKLESDIERPTPIELVDEKVESMQPSSFNSAEPTTTSSDSFVSTMRGDADGSCQKTPFEPEYRKIVFRAKDSIRHHIPPRTTRNLADIFEKRMLTEEKEKHVASDKEFKEVKSSRKELGDIGIGTSNVMGINLANDFQVNTERFTNAITLDSQEYKTPSMRAPEHRLLEVGVGVARKLKKQGSVVVKTPADSVRPGLVKNLIASFGSFEERTPANTESPLPESEFFKQHMSDLTYSHDVQPTRPSVRDLKRKSLLSHSKFSAISEMSSDSHYRKSQFSTESGNGPFHNSDEVDSQTLLINPRPEVPPRRRCRDGSLMSGENNETRSATNSRQRYELNRNCDPDINVAEGSTSASVLSPPSFANSRKIEVHADQNEYKRQLLVLSQREDLLKAELATMKEMLGSRKKIGHYNLVLDSFTIELGCPVRGVGNHDNDGIQFPYSFVILLKYEAEVVDVIPDVQLVEDVKSGQVIQRFELCHTNKIFFYELPEEYEIFLEIYAMSHSTVHVAPNHLCPQVNKMQMRTKNAVGEFYLAGHLTINRNTINDIDNNKYCLGYPFYPISGPMTINMELMNAESSPYLFQSVLYGFFGGHWEKSYAVICRTHLMFWRSKLDFQSGNPAMRSLPLDRCRTATSIRVDIQKLRPNAFVVKEIVLSSDGMSTPRNRTMLLAAETEDDRDEWVDWINCCANGHGF